MDAPCCKNCKFLKKCTSYHEVLDSLHDSSTPQEEEVILNEAKGIKSTFECPHKYITSPD